MNGRGTSVSSTVPFWWILGAFFAAGCYSPDHEITGKYDFRWTNEWTNGNADLSRCERPGGPRSTIAELDIVRDRDYAVIVHFGCKLRVSRRGSILTTSGFEKCELVPGSQAEGLGFMNRYYDIRIDVASGEVFMGATNLGENSGGSCAAADGHIKPQGTAWRSDRSKFWYYEGSGSALAERYSGTWAPNGYIEERKDGTLFVQGFGCTLPGRTAPGEKAAVPEGSCRTGVFAEYGAPELVPLLYSFNESEFSMSGEYHGADRNYTFELQSTSVRPDEWDSRHD